MAKKSNFNIGDLVKGGGMGGSKPSGKGAPPKKAKKKSSGDDVIGQPTPQRPQGMGLPSAGMGYGM